MYQTPELQKTMEADASIGKNLCVKQDSNGRATLCGADDTNFLGVTIETGKTEAPFTVGIEMRGIVQIKSDGSAAITPGDLIVCAAGGKVKKRTIASGTTNRLVIGRAMNSVAATADLLVDVNLGPFHVFST